MTVTDLRHTPPHRCKPRDLGPADDARPHLPDARGPLTSVLSAHLRGDGPLPADAVDRLGPPDRDTITDEDLQLALYVIYELSYRGFAAIDEQMERDDSVVRLRHQLEDRFEADLRHQVAVRGLIREADDVATVLRRAHGPSLSSHMARRGTRLQFREFAVHRSAYQLKEADPHSWAIPRVRGRRKAALIEIQADEYGRGVVGEAHAELFTAAMRSLELDPTYGAYVEHLPAVTLATTNLISLFGMQMRLRSALLGHLAAFEMTSVAPMSRYLVATLRLGFDERVRRFYEVHVEADDHHGRLAARHLADPTADDDGVDPAELVFGAAALSVVEDRFARHLLHAWAHDRSSLRSIPNELVEAERTGDGVVRASWDPSG